MVDMEINEFVCLDYPEKLIILSRSGELLLSFTIDFYLFTLYQLKDFYVEVKRDLADFHFDAILPMRFDELPFVYRCD